MRVPTAARRRGQPIGGRRIAGVSSFGFSGTNAHVVVEEAPAPRGRARRSATAMSATLSHLFVLSARDEPALAALARRYAAGIRLRSSDGELRDVCFTAAASRARHRAARRRSSASPMSELRERLVALAEGRPSKDSVTGRARRPRDPPRIAFLFTGQGAQYAGMARALYATQPVFRAALDRCATVLDALLPRPLLE